MSWVSMLVLVAGCAVDAPDAAQRRAHAPMLVPDAARTRSSLGAKPPLWTPPEREPLGTGAMSADGGALVLEHTSIEAEVSAGLAIVRVIQSFANPFDEPIDAHYVLPLPPDAAVRGFEVACGDRVIEGVIKDKKSAREAYEQARATGHRAALLEQMRENLFEQHIAGICPGEAVDVTVEYVQQVARDRGRAVLAFPTTIGERFGAPADLEIPRHVPAPATGGRGLDVTVAIDNGIPVAQLWSDSHAVEVWDEPGERVIVTLDPGDALPNRDVVLSWSMAGEAPRAAAVVQPPLGTQDGFIAVTLEPQLLEELDRARKRELLFVMDSSCSMSGQPWDTSAATVSRALDQMSAEDTFNLVRFADSASSLFSEPQPATDLNVEMARGWMQTPPGGGTQMTAGILHSLHMPGDDEALRLILMLTDGYIGEERRIVEVVDENLGDARIFSLGVGSSVNRLLLENLAEVGRGSVAYQLPDASIEDTVRDFYDRIAHPAMTDIELDFGGLDVWDMYPSRIPDLWAGQPLRVVARYRGSADSVRVFGEVGGEEVSLSLPLDLDTAEEHEAVTTLWARRAIHDITYDLSLSDPEREASITPLALEHHLVSAWTSLVAIEQSPSACGPAERSISIDHYVPSGTQLEEPAPPPPPPVVRSPARRPLPHPVAASPVAPEVAAPPALHFSGVRALGDLEVAAVTGVLRGAARAGLACTAQGRFTLKLVVDDAGRVTDAILQSTDIDPAAVQCLERLFSGLSFSGAGMVYAQGVF